MCDGVVWKERSNSNALRSVSMEVVECSSEVHRMAPLILAQADAAAELGAQLQEYLEAYNEAAAAMSETVLELDARIARVAQRRNGGQ